MWGTVKDLFTVERAKRRHDITIMKCPMCKGEPEEVIARYGNFKQTVTCPHCKGTGKVGFFNWFWWKVVLGLD